MMLLAYLYIRFNLFGNKGFLSSFHAVRPCVPAMAVRAVIKISEHALVDHSAGGKEISTILFACAAMGFLLTIFQTPFFVTLGFAGLVNVIYHNAHWAAGWAFLALGIVGNIIYISLSGLPPQVALAAGTNSGNKEASIFITGLLAGCTTFGGAFTAVPCVHSPPQLPNPMCCKLTRVAPPPLPLHHGRYVLRSFVLINKFMTTQQFLDGIAVVNFVPTPLVMFVTWCVMFHLPCSTQLSLDTAPTSPTYTQGRLCCWRRGRRHSDDHRDVRHVFRGCCVNHQPLTPLSTHQVPAVVHLRAGNARRVHVPVPQPQVQPLL